MYDFLDVKKEFVAKSQRYTYFPSFRIKRHMKDLMVRAKDFYAIVDPDTNMWIKDEDWAIEMIDKQVYEYALKDSGEALMEDPEHGPIVKRISDTDNHLIDKWHKFVQKDIRDSYVQLNQKVKFSNSEIKREDYCSYKLPYPLQEGPTPYYDKLVNVLYLPEEKTKFEWGLGAILAGDQNKIQKFFVFYGEPGSGKSTIISNIIADMILGGDDAPYVCGFKAEMLVNRDQFGTDFLSNDPVLAYDDEAELSRVETCTILNTIVAHETTRINPKYGRAFRMKPNCFLMCGSNNVVQLSPNSGFNRRLIDIRQTGVKLPADEYDECMEHIQFEKSGIAAHCLSVYKSLGKNYYNHYIPEDMLVLSSPFHNYVKDHYTELKNGTTLANAYSLYEIYAEACNFKTVMTRLKFRDQLKLYFENYGDRDDGDGKITKSWFSGFKEEKIGLKPLPPVTPSAESNGWLKFNETKSLFDELYFNRPAQYAKDDGTPKKAWADVKSTLQNLDTSKLHYVRTPEELIVIDLDIKDSDGKKSYEKNLEAANKFPPTYAELSKSGSGIHLHYIWTGGDPDELSRVYGDNIEVKVFKGNAALRRQLTRCNDLPIAELSSGLPKKEVKKMVDWEGFKNEKALRAQIVKAVNKDYIVEGKIPSTKSTIDFIDHILDEAYMSGVSYDVSDLQESVLGLALSSTNKADYCMNLVSYMHFKSKDQEEKENITDEAYDKAPIIFFDVESYGEGEDPVKEPALFVICWKFQGKDQKVTKMINPSPDAVKELFNYRMIGFNNLEYDNHMVWARSMGYTEAELNRLSQRLVSDDKTAKFRDASRVSYTDVYDFASSNNKQSLKKWEIELGIHHVEMNIPWDKPAPMDRWDDIAEYCANDVIATEKVFNHLYSDFVAREILADLSGLTVNMKTNRHTIAILTNGIPDPKSHYIYTKLGEMTWPDGSLMFPGYEFNKYGINRSRYKSDVKIIKGKSIYKGIDPGEGGRKIGYPGMYSNVALLDVSSMHPHSAIKLNIFGDEITKRFEALVEGRVAIKHGEYEKAIELLQVLGKDCSKYFQGSEEEVARNTAGLADALKTSINSVYGLTSAPFDNELRDPRNEDNIVAKYGALFMVNLEEEVTNMGYTVAHISTDSIKVANADQKIINYLMQRAKDYGYTFEFEALYEKMTLVNEAVYIAKYATSDDCMKQFNYIPGDNKKAEKKGMLWTPTGKQFAVPYVFKTLFSHEPIEFKDMNETFNVQKGAIYLDYKEGLPDVNVYEDPLKKLNSAYNKHAKLAKEYADPVMFAEIDMKGKRGPRTRDAIQIDIDKNNKQIEKIENYILRILGLSEGTDFDTALNTLKSEIDKGHDYRFVGKVGSFIPMIQGIGAAEMVCISDNKYAPSSPSGSKDYLWLETEVVLASEKQDYVDKTYYRKLVDDAIDAISQYGDYEWFVS